MSTTPTLTLVTSAPIRARDIMQKGVMTVTPESSILEIQRLFVEESIHGAPVVGEDGKIYGVLSTLDLLRVIREELDDSGDVDRLTAEDAMTREIVSIRSDAPVDEIAQLMFQQHIHRVLVVEDGQMIGMITSFDLLPLLARVSIETPGTSEPTHYSRGSM